MKMFNALFGGIILFAFLFSCTNTQEPTKKSPGFKGNGKTIIVDVRTPEEWNADGHADCAVNYPLDQLELHLTELSKYDTVVFVCRSGNRAGNAQSWLAGLNIGNVVMNGGAWSDVPCE
jgi:phage shock protein E